MTLIVCKFIVQVLGVAAAWVLCEELITRSHRRLLAREHRRMQQLEVEWLRAEAGDHERPS